MAAAQKQDSNTTGLRYAEETSIGVVSGSAVWRPLEPNSYDDFGGEIVTLARSPINASRQRKKGVVVDVDSAGGFNHDLVLTLQDIMQGFMFADLRRKGESVFPGVFSQAFTATFGTNTLNITTHGLSTGDGPFQVSSTTTLPSGLSGATNYWVISTGAGTLQLATSYANAIAGTAVALADNGTGTHTMVNEDSVDGTGETVTVNKVTGILDGSLVQTTGFTLAANNGVFVVTAVTGSVVTLDTNLATEANAPAAAKMVVVGYEATADDIDVDASDVLPALTSTLLDFTTLGLIPGEWIYIGGDTALTGFSNAVNNGFARIYSVAANRLVFDKTQSTMVTETSSGTRLVRMFFGRVLKNESDTSLITRRSYQLERQLGAEDTALPAQIQSEYLVGAVPNEVTFSFGTADKVMLDMSFLATDYEQRSGATGVKTGTRPAIVSAEAINTTSDFSRLKMSILDRTTGANPSALFAYVTEFNITINNNVSPNKAISVMGAFDMTAGQFAVGGTLNAYFADIAAVQAVRNNADVTLDFALVKDNTGVVIDLPLISLGDGRTQIEQDQPIMLNLNNEAAADAVFDTTLIMTFYDYLPTAAG